MILPKSSSNHPKMIPCSNELILFHVNFGRPTPLSSLFKRSLEGIRDGLFVGV